MSDEVKYDIIENNFFITVDDMQVLVPAQILHAYWRNPDEENDSKDYVSPDGRSDVLLNMIKKYCSPEDTFLEVGCNCGRNLDVLYKNGFKNLKGVDINYKALEFGMKTFPETVGKLPLCCSAIEDFLAMNPLAKYDVVFTMAVLMHIHPSSGWVLNILSKMANKYLITCEREDKICMRVFPRDYKAIFENCGMTQVHEEFHEFDNNIDTTGKVKLMYRVFSK